MPSHYAQSLGVSSQHYTNWMRWCTPAIQLEVDTEGSKDLVPKELEKIKFKKKNLGTTELGKWC